MRTRAWGIAALLATVLHPAPVRSAVRQPSAFDVARRFCQVDGTGVRLDAVRWAVVAPLVAWSLEPAWDHLVLISGYQISTPRMLPDHVEIPVEYTVIGAIAAGDDDGGVTPQIEGVVLRLQTDDRGRWRIIGPPRVPHVFANQVDVATMHELLQPDSPTYLSDSALVWRALTQAGWAIPYRPVRALRDPSLFVPVSEPAENDVALFVADDIPYHAGVVTADNLIASATINGGVMQTPAAVFPGTVLYLHLLQPRAATPTASLATDLEADEPAAPIPTPAPARRSIAVPKATPHTKKKPHKLGRKTKPRKHPTPKSRPKPRPHATPTHAPR